MKPTRPGFYPIGVAYACTARTSTDISISVGTLGTLPLVYIFTFKISIKFLYALIITKFLSKVNNQTGQKANKRTSSYPELTRN